MIEAKTKSGNGKPVKPKKAIPTTNDSADLKSSSQPNSASESDSSQKMQNLDPETRNHLQIVVRIKKELIKKLEGYAPTETNESIIFVLRGYVGQCGETSQLFIEKNEFKIAESILRSCENVLKTRVPSELTAQTGLLYQVNNNLANLSNRTGDVAASIKYLLAALDCTNDPRIQNRDDLPIAETLLNLANANTYLGKFEFGHSYAEQAYQFAAKIGDRLQTMINGCDKKKSVLGENHPEIQKQEEYYLSLIEQYQGQVNLKVMAKLATGQAFEKMEKYDHAIHEFRIGRQLVEKNFGTTHHLYPVLANAMGGARLKTKFQTKEVVHRKKKSRSPPAPEQKKKKGGSMRKVKIQSKLTAQEHHAPLAPQRNIQKMLARPQSVKQLHPRRNIQKVIEHQTVRNSHQRGLKDNLFLTNCDAWSNIHCHRPRSSKKTSTITHIVQKSGRSRSANRRFNSSLSQMSIRSDLSKKSKRTPRANKQKLSPLRNRKNIDINADSLNINITPKEIKKALDTTSKTTAETNKNQSSEEALSKQGSANTLPKGSPQPQTIIVHRDTSSDSKGCPRHQQNNVVNSNMQQMLMMRQQQEEQFRQMMQVVAQTQQQRQQHPSYGDQCCMYNPMANPYPQQMFNPMPGYYHPMGGYDPRFIPQGPQQYTSESQTETETETENEPQTEKEESHRSHHSEKKSAKKPSASKQVKQYSEDEYADTLNDRESASQKFSASKNKGMIRQSTENTALIMSASQRSYKPETFKRRTTFQEVDNRHSSGEREREYSIQLVDQSTSPQKTILKTSYHTEQQEALSRAKSEVSMKSAKSKSSAKSFRSDSEFTKSFRAQSPKLTKNAAAICIQKNFRAHATKEDFKNGVYGKLKTETKLLFKATYHTCDGGRPIITCKVICKKGFAKSLEFHVQATGGTKTKSFQISLDKDRFGNVEMYGLNNKVLTILSKCPKQGTVQQDITNVFKSQLAVDILTDNDTIDTPRDMDDIKEDSQSRGQYEKDILSTGHVESDVSATKDFKRIQMETEIRQIREMMDGDAYVLNDIEVHDHQPRFLGSISDRSSSDHSEFKLIDEGDVDRIKPVVIEKVIVNRRFRQGRDRSHSNDSEHSYKVLLQEQEELVLWSGEVKNLGKRFDVKLVKNDFLEYVLSASNNLTRSFEIVKYDHLPFEEEDAITEFDKNFTLEQKDGVITKISLKQFKPRPKQENLMLKNVSNSLNASVSGSFAQQRNVNRKILYVYNIERHETEYHVEITKQFTEQYHLFVYALQVQRVGDKEKMSLEMFEGQNIELLTQYIENNLKINRKIGSQMISHISLTYTADFLKSMKHNIESDESDAARLMINRSEGDYKITLIKTRHNEVKIICENESDPTDYCIFRSGVLKSVGDNLQEFIQRNLLIFLSEEGKIHQLKIAGYTDGESLEVEEEMEAPKEPTNFWRKIAEEELIQCNTLLVSSLQMKVNSEEEVESDAQVSVDDDIAWYKVALWHVKQEKEIGSLVLTPSQVQQLFDKDSFKGKESIGADNLKVRNLQGIQLTAAVKNFKYEKNTDQWKTILFSAIYKQSIKQVLIKKQEQVKKSTKKTGKSYTEEKSSYSKYQMESLNVWEQDKHMVALEAANKRALYNIKKEITLSFKADSDSDQPFAYSPKAQKRQKRVVVQQTSESESEQSIQSVKSVESIREEYESKEDRTKAQIKKKLEVLKQQKKELKQQKKMLDSDDESNIKIVSGSTKSNDGAYYNCKINFDRASGKIHLSVRNQFRKGKDITKSQLLTEAYIQKVTKQSQIKQDDEDTPLRLLKDDIEARMRQFGKKYCKRSKGKLPDGFFNDKLEDEDVQEEFNAMPEEEFDFEEDNRQASKAKKPSKSRTSNQIIEKELAEMNGANEEDDEDHEVRAYSSNTNAREQTMKKLNAAKQRSRDDLMQKSLDQEREQAVEDDLNDEKMAKGNVKCRGNQNIWCVFKLVLNLRSKQIFLTINAKTTKGQKTLSKKQKLSKAYIGKYTANSTINSDDEDGPLRLISDDITRRLQAFGEKYAKNSTGSLPDSFFTERVQVHDDQLNEESEVQQSDDEHYRTGRSGHSAKDRVKMKIQAARSKSRDDREKKLERTITPEQDPHSITSRGNVKCDGKKNLWVNFILSLDISSKQVTLTVNKNIAKNQQLKQSYIKQITGLASIQENDSDEPMNNLSNDIQKRLRAFGEKYAKNPTGSLPDSFFTTHVEVDEQEVDFQESESPKEGHLVMQGDQSDDMDTKSNHSAKDRVKMKITAARQQSSDRKELQLERQLTPLDDPETLTSRGNVKLDGNNIWVNFVLSLNLKNKQFTLNVNKGIAKDQQLSNSYIKQTIAIDNSPRSIRTNDEDEPLRMITDDIQTRLRVFGQQHALQPSGSLADSFFTTPLP